MGTQNKTNKELCEFVASRIRRERKHQGFTQETIALHAGISLRTYKRFELTGKGTISTLIEILRALNRLQALDAMLPGAARQSLSLIERIKILERSQNAG